MNKWAVILIYFGGMKVQHDIRLKIIDLNLGLKILKGFEGNWIYIKIVSFASSDNDNCAYFKFKLKDFEVFDNNLFFYGNEDEDRLFLNKKNILQTECSFNEDEILFKMDSSGGIIEVFIKKYLPILNVRLEELANPRRNIIITEGKTDWKHLKYALKKLNENGEFLNLDISFFEFEQKIEMGNDTLKKIRDYHALLENEYCKIFIFDRDVDEINNEFGNKEVLYHGNNVYSMLLPVPEHRKNTPNISIEHYYLDKDLFRKDNNGRRLYMVKEFDKITKKHLLLPNLYATKIKKEHSDIRILDERIMKYEEQEIAFSKIAQNGINIALSKSNFTKCIENEEFKEVDLTVFTPVFLLIEEILKDHMQKKYGEIEISKNVYLKEYPSGINVLSLYSEITEELLLLYKGTNSLRIAPFALKEHNKLIINVEAYINEEYRQIIAFPIDINPSLKNFVIDKNNNRFNRIELHLFNPNRKISSSREILKDDISGMLLLRELDMI